MDFFVLNQTGENISTLMRQLGYRFYSQDEPNGEISFVKPLGQDPYPRFHIYLKEDPQTNEIAFNLHLDQRRPVYKGASAHSADYEGEVVEKEAERIKQFFGLAKKEY